MRCSSEAEMGIFKPLAALTRLGRSHQPFALVVMGLQGCQILRTILITIMPLPSSATLRRCLGRTTSSARETLPMRIRLGEPAPAWQSGRKKCAQSKRRCLERTRCGRTPPTRNSVGSTSVETFPSRLNTEALAIASSGRLMWKSSITITTCPYSSMGFARRRSRIDSLLSRAPLTCSSMEGARSSQLSLSSLSQSRRPSTPGSLG
mmetsp:Transcript_37277/g.76400  ORF Transcript_37277/g.76400 Transcript_37277/m.76400 type:complete len:206 (-) Transcript_37277:445-1062(-)